jgi:hypothetical protein
VRVEVITRAGCRDNDGSKHVDIPNNSSCSYGFVLSKIFFTIVEDKESCVVNLVVSTRIKKPWKYLQGLIAGASYGDLEMLHNSILTSAHT